MDEESRTRIEGLVRKATVAFYDDSSSAEMESSVEVEYLTREGLDHTVEVVAPSHEYDNERPVWVDIDEVTLDIEPEKVGESRYRLRVTVTESSDSDGGFVFGDQGQNG